jgi:hypothetical protein
MLSYKHFSKWFLSSLIIILASVSGCKKETKSIIPQEFNYTFQSGTEGWTGDFADYPNQPDVETFYDLKFSSSVLPTPLNSSDGALMQSGINHSDDLFMFIKKKISGLVPNAGYKVSIEMEIASNVADGTAGVGGSPGEGVFIKAGASALEPLKVLDVGNIYRMNIDKGNQSDGIAMKLIGNFANGSNAADYKLKRMSTSSPVSIQSNANGELWLIVGTDSGFEGKTTIYYNSIKVVMN